MALQLRRAAAELHHLVDGILHVIAKIIEAELVVRAVGNIAGIGPAALVVVKLMHDAADGEAKELVDLAHPFGVALGKVIVHRDDVDAPAGQRIQIGSKGGDERFAFAGLHLGDLALVKHHAADELNVEMPLAKGALCALPHRGESFRQEIVDTLAIG